MKKIFDFIRNIVTIGTIVGIGTLGTLTSCIDEEERADTAAGNFEALWQIIDEHYCFFEYKQHEYGLDWDEVYHKYKVRMNDQMTEPQALRGTL